MFLRSIRSPLDQLSRRNHITNPRHCMDAIHLYAHQLNPTTRTITYPTTRAMSSMTLKDLTYISREDLSNHILSPSPSNNIAIIDVRDWDHAGGHIKGSTWVPSAQLDYKTPELVRTLRDKEVVVFHCALSQQRGPSAALRYLREKRRLFPEGIVESKVVKEGDLKEEENAEGKTEEIKEKKAQKVLVLDGGFTKWQEKFGEDERLTEGYQKDIWEFGYDG